MADNPPDVLYSQFCDLAFIEYKERNLGKSWNCGTAGRKQIFLDYFEQISWLKIAIQNNRIRYDETNVIPNTYKFLRKDGEDYISDFTSNSFHFVGALIYHPTLRMFISHVPNNLYDDNPHIVQKLFTHFFVEEEDDIRVTQNKFSGSSRNSSLPINNSFYSGTYIERVKTHFGWIGNPNVDSLFNNSLKKTLTQFIIEASRLETTKNFNPFNVINKYNTGDKIIAEMGIPFLIAGYYDNGEITLYPNIPVYQFLLKDRAAYDNEYTRLAQIEAARLARERALIASVVAIHANKLEEPRPLARNPGEEERERLAREGAEANNKAVVASIVAINSEEAARLREAERLAREAEAARLEAERQEEAEARQRLEAARLEAERQEAERQRLAREAANKAVVASIVAINSKEVAQLEAEADEYEDEEVDEPAPIVNNDSNNIAAIIAAIIQQQQQQPQQPLVRVPSSNNKIPSRIAAIMDTTRNHIVKVSELETLLNSLDFLWFINELKCSGEYKKDKTFKNIIEPEQNYNDSIHRLTKLRDRNENIDNNLYNEYNEEHTKNKTAWLDNEQNIKYQQYKQSIMIPIQEKNIQKDSIELLNQKLQHENAKEQIKYADDIIDSEKEHIFCKYYWHTSSTHINNLKRLLLQNVNKLLAVPKFKNKTIDDTVFKTLKNTIIYDIFYKIIIKTTIMDARIEKQGEQYIKHPMYIKRELNKKYLNSIKDIIQYLIIPNCENIKFTDQNMNGDYYDKYNTSVLIEGFKEYCKGIKLAFINDKEFTDSYTKKEKRKAKPQLIKSNLYNIFMTYINNNKILKENMIFYWGSDETKWMEHYNSNHDTEDRLKLTRLYEAQAGLDTKINDFLMDSSTPNLKIKFFIFFCIGFLYQDAVIFYRRIQSKDGITTKAQFGMDVNNQGEYYNDDNSVKDNILYCTNDGTIPNIEYTEYTDAQGLPDDNNTERDNCKDDKCYPTMDVVVEKIELVLGKSKNNERRVGRPKEDH